jgi:hypothetical protein
MNIKDFCPLVYKKPELVKTGLIYSSGIEAYPAIRITPFCHLTDIQYFVFDKKCTTGHLCT